jgi:uroporphyrinogen decarboxylase
MIEGQGTKTYEKCKKLIYTQPKMMHSLLQKLTDVTKLYLQKQIEAGADVVQVFDSWAGALEKDAYFEFSWAYMVEIAEYIKEKYPHIPVILFPKGIGQYLDDIYGNFDVFGVDWSTPMELAKEKLGDKYVLQGNMEPTRLYSKEATTQAVENIHDIMKGEGHIFNLGHGILPDVPVDNAQHFISEVHRVTKK